MFAARDFQPKPGSSRCLKHNAFFNIYNNDLISRSGFCNSVIQCVPHRKCWKKHYVLSVCETSNSWFRRHLKYNVFKLLEVKISVFWSFVKSRNRRRVPDLSMRPQPPQTAHESHFSWAASGPRSSRLRFKFRLINWYTDSGFSIGVEMLFSIKFIRGDKNFMRNLNWKLTQKLKKNSFNTHISIQISIDQLIYWFRVQHWGWNVVFNQIYTRG